MAIQACRRRAISIMANMTSRTRGRIITNSTRPWPARFDLFRIGNRRSPQIDRGIEEGCSLKSKWNLHDCYLQSPLKPEKSAVTSVLLREQQVRHYAGRVGNETVEIAAELRIRKCRPRCCRVGWGCSVGRPRGSCKSGGWCWRSRWQLCRRASRSGSKRGLSPVSAAGNRTAVVKRERYCEQPIQADFRVDIFEI